MTDNTINIYTEVWNIINETEQELFGPTFTENDILYDVQTLWFGNNMNTICVSLYSEEYMMPTEYLIYNIIYYSIRI